MGIASMFVPPTKHYWSGLFGELGRMDAQRYRAWRVTRKAQRRQRTAKPAETVAESLPSTISAAIPPASYDPDRAAVVSIGGGESVVPDFLGTAATRWHRQARAGERARWKADRATAEANLFEAIGAEIAAAEAEVAAGRRDWVAVLFDLPLSGDWDDDARLDLGKLFAAVFSPISCFIWAVYMEPVDPSPWPADVYLESPGPPEELVERLAAAGIEGVAGPPTVVGRQVRLDRAAAARALPLLLAAPDQGEDEASSRSLPTALPPYSPHLMLAIRTKDPLALGCSLNRTTELASELQERMRGAGLRLTGVAGAGTLLPLTPFRGQVVAWRAPVVAKTRPLEIAEEAWPRDPFEAALRERDEAAAAEILVDQGRAWIETPGAARYVELLERVPETFPADGAAALWARYLRGVDSALRLERPDAHWFDEEHCVAAGPHGLEPLFRAERMEFARLRGELEQAVGLAAAAVRALGDAAEEGDSAAVYSRATAHFLFANLLRRGGRYDLAREQVERALAAYDTEVPSHAVEAMHCRYALAVCDAVEAIPRVDEARPGPSDQLVFARALVTLSNAQAAWFVGDFDRAVEFAEASHGEFDRIGYERYATRAGRVARIVSLWQALNASEPPAASDDPLARLILDGAVGHVVSLDLAAQRPSTALTVLLFLRRFGDATALRGVNLPPVLAEAEGELILQPAQSEDSIEAADRALRLQMGIGPQSRVALLPD
jgi:tetratricopeptide (TPR) repeat protein